MSSLENPDVPTSSKRFVPLGTGSKAPRVEMLTLPENNPEVMSSLLHELGLSSTIGFHDVFSIDEPELLAFVPRPAYALLLVFPVTNNYEKFRLEEDKDKTEYTGSGPQEEVLWFKQTIGNACGLIGLLHGASNGPVTELISRYLPDDCLCKSQKPNPLQRRTPTLRNSCNKQFLSNLMSVPIYSISRGRSKPPMPALLRRVILQHPKQRPMWISTLCALSRVKRTTCGRWTVVGQAH